MIRRDHRLGLTERITFCRSCVNMTVVPVLLVLMTGCIHTVRHGGVSTMAPMRKVAAEVHYLNPKAHPQQLHPADYCAIESIVGRIAGLGDPVVITDIFTAWQNVITAVLYRTKEYDIYLIRDSKGRWLLSEITNAPVP